MKHKYNHLKVFWSIFDIKNIDTNEKIVLLALLKYAGADNRAWPSYESLSSATGLHRTTVINKIKSLIAKKYILKSETVRNKTNRYSLHIRNIINKFISSDEFLDNDKVNLGSSVGLLGSSVGLLGSSVGLPPEVAQDYLKNKTIPLHDKSVCSGDKKESQNVQVDNASADAASSPLTATKKEEELEASTDPLADKTDEQLEVMLKSPLAHRIIEFYGSHPRILAMIDRSNKKGC